MWKGYGLEIYSRDSERRLTSHRVRKNAKMGIVSAIERQIYYFKTQFDVHITEEECNDGFEENCSSLKLLDYSCKMPTKGIAICMLLNIPVNILNIFFILVM